MSDKPFQGLMNNRQGSGKRRLRAYNDQAVPNSIVRALVPDTDTAPTGDQKGDRKINEHVIGKVFRRARLTGSAINDYKVIMETQPDLKRVESLIVDGVLSPNDATPQPLQYRIRANDFPSKELVSQVTDVIQDFFRNKHKIDGRLRDYLGKILFSQGSVPKFVAPQASIDEMINPSKTRIAMESLENFIGADLKMTQRGILGNGVDWPDGSNSNHAPKINTQKLKEQGLGVEDWKQFCKGEAEDKNPLGYSVTDNPGIIVMHRLGEAMRDAEVANKLGPMYLSHLTPKVSTESDDEMSLVEKLREEGRENPDAISEMGIYRRTFKSRLYAPDAVKSVKTLSSLDRPTVGHPVEFELSAECVVPIHTPGNPSEHVAYLVALDSSGAPLSLTDDMDGYEGLMARQSTATNSMSTTLQSTYSSLMDSSDMAVADDKAYLRPEEMEQMYAEIMEKDLLERLRNGVFGDNVTISRPADLYRMMLFRALKQQHTRILFVPKSMMTYMAHDYDQNGVGKSLLNDVRILAALRTVLLFAHVNGEIKNSLAMVKLLIELDPEDPEPEVTVEEILHHYVSMRSSGFVYGARPADIQHMLSMSGVDVEVTGNEGYAQTRVSTEDTQRSVNTPNEDLEERLRNMIYSGIGGVPPELVDRADDIDFAATYIGSNIQLTKLVMNIQGPFCEHLAGYIRNFTLMSSILMDKLTEVVQAHRKNLGKSYQDHSDVEIVIELLDRLEVSLPRPKTATTAAQLESLEEYERLIDRELDFFLSEDVLSETEYGEKVSEHSNSIKASIKSKLMRDYIRENSISPELIDMFDYQDEEELNVIMTQMSEYRGRLSKLLRPFLRNAVRQAKVNDRILSDLEEPDDSYGGGDDYGGGDAGGGDDFGLDDDFGGGEEGDFDFGGPEESGGEEEEPPEEPEEDEGNPDENT